MLANILPWLGDLHEMLPQLWMTPITSLSAIICGGIIGWERQRAEKPAGLRTLILICLGSAMFTQASIILSGGIYGAERGRVAAQIVTGIGFLGAGAIIRERGQIVGITTGAGIWATAAVGMVLGEGHIASGIFFTGLIAGILAAAGRLERLAEGPCKLTRIKIEFDPDHGKTHMRIQNILEDALRMKLVSYQQVIDQPGAAIVTYCENHREHHMFISDLINIPEVKKVEPV